MSEATERANEWIVGDDTGLSSKALWAKMVGLKTPGTNHPSDGGDLGRCIRLLEAVPEWKTRLPEMASVSPYWAALVAHWPELEALYGVAWKAPRSDRHAWTAVYERMKELLRPIEDKDRNIVRLSDTVSIRRGA